MNGNDGRDLDDGRGLSVMFAAKVGKISISMKKKPKPLPRLETCFFVEITRESDQRLVSRTRKTVKI